ncbi:hypothetical protein ACCAA_70006 [Candidatus Accumulibacter aalborgensis]|uniref:Uncharacterized protein n=1 Tax=Candidatus Accumulibacter aalborgensis TaxID=1860102 RepID=A0A1A8XXA1_9PROT|nr:hypothetical protein ACCAA_70006 [Candidatus Accumulibacter aalborgensis]
MSCGEGITEVALNKDTRFVLHVRNGRRSGLAWPGRGHTEEGLGDRRVIRSACRVGRWAANGKGCTLLGDQPCDC